MSEKIIKRDQIGPENEEYREILDKETHHQHEIVEDESGTWRWKQNPKVRELIDNKIDLNSLTILLRSLGYGLNSEVYRKLYRDLGYSLFRYWEVFYFPFNNSEFESYEPNKIP